jgi:hypothetical protein
MRNALRIYRCGGRRFNSNASTAMRGAKRNKMTRAENGQGKSIVRRSWTRRCARLSTSLTNLSQPAVEPPLRVVVLGIDRDRLDEIADDLIDQLLLAAGEEGVPIASLFEALRRRMKFSNDRSSFFMAPLPLCGERPALAEISQY